MVQQATRLLLKEESLKKFPDILGKVIEIQLKEDTNAYSRLLKFFAHIKPSCKLLFLYMLALFKLQQQRAATLSSSIGDYNIYMHEVCI